MEPKMHWEKIYNTKAPNEVSWYQPHLETSLALINRAATITSATATPASRILILFMRTPLWSIQ
jgi:hypothetical protein